MSSKLEWSGKILSVQPRIRLTRSFDERSHSYLGYALRVDGTINSELASFVLGVGPAAHEKFQFGSGDRCAGLCEAVADARTDPVDYYKVSKVHMVERNSDPGLVPPPWKGIAPTLDEYRVRGHRRLAVQPYERVCHECVFGCTMAVEMIIDHWKPDIRRYRSETFCYGPKSCPEYRAGPTRKVPGRNGMTWEEEDWVDEDNTGHRND